MSSNRPRWITSSISPSARGLPGMGVDLQPVVLFPILGDRQCASQSHSLCLGAVHAHDPHLCPPLPEHLKVCHISEPMRPAESETGVWLRSWTSAAFDGAAERPAKTPDNMKTKPNRIREILTSQLSRWSMHMSVRHLFEVDA